MEEEGQKSSNENQITRLKDNRKYLDFGLIFILSVFNQTSR